MKALIRAIATLGPIGTSPVAPATGASAVVTLVAWFIPGQPLPIALGALAVGSLVSIWICGEAEKQLGHDAHPIVLDELIGQSAALLLVPKHALAYFAAFVLFRVFDIWKPLGARQAQHLPGGIGIVVDDLIAGLVACGVLHAGLLALRSMGF